MGDWMGPRTFELGEFDGFEMVIETCWTRVSNLFDWEFIRLSGHNQLVIIIITLWPTVIF